jgi:5'(3')-deoxyribonucleotidase
VLDYRIFATMNVIDGAAEALWELSEAGVWIRIITHRLHLKGGHSAAMADTVEWLDRNGIPFRDICFLGAKKDVGADMYVDDSPGNVETLRAAGGTTVVFSQPYNTHVGGLRADGWSDVVDLVSAAVSARG